jgi:hypothetical protein
MLEKTHENQSGLAEAPPHYHGHRERLRERFLKPMPKRVTAEWMAQQWRDGRRASRGSIWGGSRRVHRQV